MHMNNITQWRELDSQVEGIIEKTCFGSFLGVLKILRENKGILNIPLNFVTALTKHYIQQFHCFQIGSGENQFHLDFGLEDILYITGLPIDGNPVTGMIHDDATQILMEHLALEKTVAEDMLKVETKPHLKGGVNLEKLLNHFKTVEISEVGVEVHAKAFILYLVGTTLLPTRTRTVLPAYLLLLDFKKIDGYAWGAAVLANIKKSMIEKSSTSLCCFSLALTVFILERFSFLRDGIETPSEHPLLLGWIPLIHKNFKPKKNLRLAQYYIDRFNDATENDVNWMPYERLAMPISRFGDQLRLKYALVPCICYYNICMVRPDLCYKQLGIEKDDLKEIPIPNISLVSPSRHKDINLQTYPGSKKRKYNYGELNDLWANRLSRFVYSETEVGNIQQIFLGPLLM